MKSVSELRELAFHGRGYLTRMALTFRERMGHLNLKWREGGHATSERLQQLESRVLLSGTVLEQISTSSEAQHNRNVAISEDGRFAVYDSRSTDIVAADTDAFSDIFLRDRQENRTYLVSRNQAGESGNRHSEHASVVHLASEGLVRVSFHSGATNLSVVDGNGQGADVFVVDFNINALTEELLFDSIRKVSGTHENGTELNGFKSENSHLSTNGQVVVFESSAPMVLGDSGNLDIYAYDLVSDQIEIISANDFGAVGNLDSEKPRISSDGRYVAFQSAAKDLVHGDSNNRDDVFLHDRVNNSTIRVSVDDLGGQYAADSQLIDISSDGQLIAYRNSNTTYLYDLNLRANIDSFILPPVTDMTADGRYLLIDSIVDYNGDADNGQIDVYLYDRLLDEYTLASVTETGVLGDNQSRRSMITENGQWIGFDSLASNFASGDTNGVFDAFVKVSPLDFSSHISLSGETTSIGSHITARTKVADIVISGGGTPVLDGEDAGLFEISGTELFLVEDALTSVSDHLLELIVKLEDPGTPGSYLDAVELFIQVVDTSGQIRRVSHLASGQQFYRNALNPDVSQDGRFTVFDSVSPNIVSSDTNSRFDVFLQDEVTGLIYLVSRNEAGDIGDLKSEHASVAHLEEEGKVRVTFESSARNLIDEDTNNTTDIYLVEFNIEADYTLSFSTIRRVSGIHENGQEVTGHSTNASLSTNGQYVVFESTAMLLNIDRSDDSDIYLYDVNQGDIEMISVNDFGGAGENEDSINASISDGGRYIAFESLNKRLADNDQGNFWDVYVRDRQTGQTRMISVNNDGTQTEHTGYGQISGDGRYVTFTDFRINSYKARVVHNSTHVYDMQLNMIVDQITGRFGDFNSNGRYYAFETGAELVSEDNDQIDIYIYDLQRRTYELVSQSASGVLGNSNSARPSLSADGTTVVFHSHAATLVPGDTNNVFDVYAASHALPEKTIALKDQLVEISDGVNSSLPITVAEILTTGFPDPSQLSADNFELDGEDADLFQVDTDNGWLQLIAGVDLDYLQNPSLEVTMKLLDGGELVDTVDLFVKVVPFSPLIERVSLGGDRNQLYWDAINVDLSADGRFAVFETVSRFVTQDQSGFIDIYLHDSLYDKLYRVSQNPAGSDANHSSHNANVAYIESEGIVRVSFESKASNLIELDDNLVTDVFVAEFQEQSGTTDLTRVGITRASDGAFGSRFGDSVNARLSGNGGFVAYESNSVLSSEDTRVDGSGAFPVTYTDIYVYDIAAGTNRLVSKNDFGAPATGNSKDPSISHDGSRVTFETGQKLADEDRNGEWDVYMHDLSNGRTRLISGEADGSLLRNQDGGNSEISGDGRFVYYNMTNVDASGRRTISGHGFIYDLSHNLRTHTFIGQLGEVNYDGRFAAVKTGIGEVPEDNNGLEDIYVFDKETGRSELISHNLRGEAGEYASVKPSISADGLFVGFHSASNNLVPWENNLSFDVYVAEHAKAHALPQIALDNTVLALVENAAAAGPIHVADIHVTGFGTPELIGPDAGLFEIVGGDQIVLKQTATLEYATNPELEVTVFISDPIGTGTDEVDLFIRVYPFAPPIERVSLDDSGEQIYWNARDVKLSDDGRFAVFETVSRFVNPADGDKMIDIFLHDREMDQVYKVSRGMSGDANHNSQNASVVYMPDDDLVRVSFESDASNLVANDDNGKTDIFVAEFSESVGGDLNFVRTIRASEPAFATPYQGDSINAMLSGNGRYVVYESFSRLTSEDTVLNKSRNPWVSFSDIYRYDILMGENQLVSLNESDRPTGRQSSYASINYGGDLITFETDAGMVSTDRNGEWDVYLRNIGAGTTTLVSFQIDGNEFENDSGNALITGNGRFVMYNTTTRTSNGRTVQGHGYVYELATGLQVDTFTGRLTGVSDDGDFISLHTRSARVPEDLNGFDDIYVHDRTTDSYALVSNNMLGEQGNSNSVLADISGDGKFIGFHSAANNLVPWDTNITFDAFVTVNPLNSDNASIEGHVWLETDRDGIYQLDEEDFNQITVYLFDSGDNLVDTALTDVNGDYRFDGLSAQQYKIQFTNPEGYAFVDQDQGISEQLDSDVDANGELLINVSAGEDIDFIDAGLFLMVSTIEGVKWADLDEDGVKDPGEQGIHGFRIYLDEDEDNQLDWEDENGNHAWDAGEGERWVRTNGDGYYIFEDLPIGNYTVREVHRDGFLQSYPSVTEDGEHRVNLALDVPLVLNFGNIPYGSICGVNFVDLNTNGEPDAGEVGLSEATVILQDQHGVEVDRSTGPSFHFENLLASNGPYTLISVLPNGYTRTTSADLTGVPVINGEPTCDQDFGFAPHGAITGYKWHDRNMDGVKQTNEEYLSGVTIFLDDNNNGELDGGETSDVTDSLGRFDFTGLDYGGYRVREVVPENFALVHSSHPLITAVLPGQPTEVIFGNVELGVIEGYVWSDNVDQDETYHGNEPGLSGWRVFIDSDKDGQLDTGETSTITDSSGYYQFTGLMPVHPGNEYRIAQVDKNGWKQVSPDIPAAPVNIDYWDIDLDPGVTEQAHFGNLELGSISGRKWIDLDQDGVMDPDEPGLSTIRIYIDLEDDGFDWVDHNANDIFDAGDEGDPWVWTSRDNPNTEEDESGYYTIRNLIPTNPNDPDTPNEYIVKEEIPGDMVQTFPDPVSTGGEYRVAVAPGQHLTELDFGNIGFGQISGTKWNDLNENGVRDTVVTTGISPDIVFIVDTSGSAGYRFVGTSVGDRNGNGTPDQIIDAEIAGFSLLNQQLIDLGLGESASVAIISFSTYSKFVDMNPEQDGVQQSTNPSSDADGEYGLDVDQAFMNLSARGATNFESPLQNAISFFQSQGTLPGTGAVVFLSDGDRTFGGDFDDEAQQLRDMGIHLSAYGVGPGADLDELRIIDPDAIRFDNTDQIIDEFSDLESGALSFQEPGLAGVTIFLDRNGNGRLDDGEESTVTMQDDPNTAEDETGRYFFDMVLPGDYQIREIVPLHFEQTFPDPEEGGFYDIHVRPGQTIAGKNFGNVPLNTVEGYVWHDIDGDGIKEAGEPGMAGVTVHLHTDGDSLPGPGPVTLSMVTMADDPLTDEDETGFYKFIDLSTDDYTVWQDIPDGYAQTYPNLSPVLNQEPHEFRLGPVENKTDVDFGNTIPQGRIKGAVRDTAGAGMADVIVYIDGENNGRLDWIDRDGDERWDDGEGDRWMRTLADGSYSFDPLIMDTYIIRQVIPQDADYVQIVPDPQSGDGAIHVGLGLNEDRCDQDFVNGVLSTISGYKYHDVNGNGVWDTDELTLSGWEIFLDEDEDGELDGGETVTVTDHNGYFEFSGLHQDAYVVAEVMQDGWGQTAPYLTDDEEVIRVNLGWGQNREIAFGNAMYVTLSGHKWLDADADGFRDTTLVNGTAPFLLYVLDVSFSASETEFSGTPVGDQNGDGIANSVLDAEIAGLIALNNQLISLGYGASADVGLVLFAGDARLIDLDAGPQIRHLGTPGEITSQLVSVQAGQAQGQDLNGDATNFESALQAGLNYFDETRTLERNGTLIFLSDGANNLGGDFADEVELLSDRGVILNAMGAGAEASINDLAIIDEHAEIFTSTDEIVDHFAGLGTTRYLEPGWADVRIYIDSNHKAGFVENELDWTDGNGNGLWDDGEGERWVYTSEDITFTLEDEAGYYELTGLLPGDYVIREELPPESYQTSPGVPNDEHEVTTVSGDIIEHLDFGNKPNNLPPQVQLRNRRVCLHEDAEIPAEGLHVADILIIDDGVGVNMLELIGDQKGLFELRGNAIYLVGTATLDYETLPELEVGVRVDDPTVGESPDDQSLMTITIKDVLEADITIDYRYIYEGAQNGTPVGTVRVVNAGEDFDFTFIDSADGRFEIDADTGLITVKDTDRIDFEEQPSHLVTVEAIGESTGQVIRETIRINIIDRASIYGRVYEDVNGDAFQSFFEFGMANIRVFLDEGPLGFDWTDGNENDVWDEGEGDRWVLTNRYGDFYFDDLDDGDYVVKQVIPNDFTQIKPVSPDHYEVTVGMNHAPANLIYANQVINHAPYFVTEVEGKGDDFQVSTTSVRNMQRPDVVATEDGFMLAWSGEDPAGQTGYGVFTRSYNLAGYPISNDRQIDLSTIDEINSSTLTPIAYQTTGHAIVAWQQYDEINDRLDVMAQRFNTAGFPAGDAFQVNDDAPTNPGLDHYEISIAVQEDNSFVIVWRSRVDDFYANIVGQRLDQFGEKIGGEFIVSTEMGNLLRPEVTALSGNEFLVVWEHNNGQKVSGQRLGADGDKIGDAFAIEMTTSQTWPDVVELDNGNLVVVWESGDVFAQQFNRQGQTVGDRIQVNTFESSLNVPSVAALTNGRYVVTWDSRERDGSNRGVAGQIIDSNGQKLGDEFLINTTTSGSQSQARVAVLANGDFVVTWINRQQIYARCFKLTDLHQIDLNIDENYPVDLIFHDADALDPDNDVLVYTLGGDDADDFQIDPETGEVQFKHSPDYETKDSYTFDIIATDPGGLFDIQTVTIQINDIDEAPEIISPASVNVYETISTEIYAHQVVAVDPEMQPITYGISGGVDASLFDINPVTGEVFFLTSPDFEVPHDDNGNNAYQITVSAGDGVHTVFKDVTINVLDWYENEVPIGNDDENDIIEGEDEVWGRIETGERRAFKEAEANQLNSHVAGFSDGGYVLVWLEYDLTAGSFGVYGQVYDATGDEEGLVFEVDVDQAASHGYQVQVLNDQSFAVFWAQSRPDGSGSDIAMQQFGRDGQATSGRTLITSAPGLHDSSPSIASLGTQGYILTWHRFSNQLQHSEIHALRLDENLQRVGDSFQVNTHTPSSQRQPHVTALPRAADGGRFLITWESLNQDGSQWGVFGQVFKADGSAQGTEFQINTYSEDFQFHPVSVPLLDGGFAIAWESVSQDGSGTDMDIMLQRFDRHGQKVGGELRVNTNRDGSARENLNISTWRLSMTTLSNHNLVVIWEMYDQDGGKLGVFGQLLDQNLNRLGEEFQVNTHTADDQWYAAVAPLADGGFVVTWSSVNQADNDIAVYTQRFNQLGTPLPGSASNHLFANDLDLEPLTVVSVNGVLPNSPIEVIGLYGELTVESQTGEYVYRLNNSLPEVIALNDGEILVDYFEVLITDGTFEDTTNLVITIHGVSNTPVNLIVNGSFEDLGGQSLNRSGGRWGTFQSLPGWQALDGAEHGPIEIQNRGTGGTYAQHGENKLELNSHDFLNEPGSNSRVFQDIDTDLGESYELSVFYSPRIANGTDTDDVQVWWGDELLETLTPQKSGDQWRQFTYTVTGKGNTRLEFRAVGKDDTLGGFIDNVSLYALGNHVGGSTNAVVKADPDIDGTDTDNQVTGTSGSDTVNGSGGDDTITTKSGSDTIDAGSGDDTVNGGGGDDYLSGGTGDDELKGGSGDDLAWGGSGDDTLKGNRGDDILNGEAGDDILRGGKGDDLLNGGIGTDWLRAGTGYDIMIGGADMDYFVIGNNLLKENLTDDIDDGINNKTTIADFNPGVDKIILQSGLIKNHQSLGVTNTVSEFGFDDLLSLSTDTVDGLLIVFRSSYGDNVILIENVTLAELSASDFIFGGKTGSKHFENGTGVY